MFNSYSSSLALRQTSQVSSIILPHPSTLSPLHIFSRNQTISTAHNFSQDDLPSSVNLFPILSTVVEEAGHCPQLSLDIS